MLYMGIILSNKFITPSSMNCTDLATVQLTLTAAPDITSNPVDIMLVLDRSGSMSGTPLTALKAAANEFIDIIQNATNPSGPNIGLPSRIGIVSFATDATLDNALTDNVADLKTTIANLVADGNTNHKAAFELATTNYTPVLTPPNKKIMVMFTDGNTTIGGNADSAAAAARADGIEIYCIGLGNGIDVSNLNNWATPPTNTHVLIAPTPADLIQAFQDLAANIIHPGSTNIVVLETIEDQFEIIATSIATTQPNTSIAEATLDATNKTLTWTIDQLGITTTETATLTFNVKYTSCTSGTLPLNKSITFSDNEGNQVTFTPNITEITLDCTPTIAPDCCEAPVSVHFDNCDTVIDMDLPSPTGAYDLKCNGRLLILGIRLKNICVGRRVALGVIVSEVINGTEYSRGFKAITVPAQTCPGTCPCQCQTVHIKPITFVLPEDLDNTPDLCDTRDFRVRVIAHYIDTGITKFNVCPVHP